MRITDSINYIQILEIARNHLFYKDDPDSIEAVKTYQEVINHLREKSNNEETPEISIEFWDDII